MKIYTLAILSIVAFASSCSCSRNASVDHARSSKKQIVKKVSEITAPQKQLKLILGEEFPVSVSWPDTMTVDSVQVFFRGKRAGAFNGAEQFMLSTIGSSTGKAGVRTKLYFSNGKAESHSRQIEILSDLIPAQYTYELIQKYPHDIGAYTQGLLMYDGWLYEGTGNYNQSTVRKVRLSDGDPIQVRNNASDVFGEGITIFNGKIYQLTYKSQVCFVYDLNTFEEVQKYYYQNKEGWGLTNNSDELIMSDGTNVLYFLDPDMFIVKHQLEVYDHSGPVSDLNELEYIDGKIYANRYYTDEIVIIDPSSGKVEARVDLKGILPVTDRKASTNVLNGIAWDSEKQHLYVTGKYWPWLYEITLKSHLQ